MYFDDLAKIKLFYVHGTIYYNWLKLITSDITLFILNPYNHTITIKIMNIGS